MRQFAETNEKFGAKRQGIACATHCRLTISGENAARPGSNLHLSCLIEFFIFIRAYLGWYPRAPKTGPNTFAFVDQFQKVTIEKA